MRISFIAVTVLFLAGCVQSQNNSGPAPKIPAGNTNKPAGAEAVAYFAEGCFWHTEIVFQSLEGVRDAISGYSGGTDSKPDYEKVSSGETESEEASRSGLGGLGRTKLPEALHGPFSEPPSLALTRQ